MLRTLLLAVLLAGPTALAQRGPDIELYRAAADRIIAAALADSVAFERMAVLVDTYPRRLSGSDGLEGAIDWLLDLARTDGLQNVRGQEVMVPHWERGEEFLAMVSPRAEAFAMLGLGGSIGTPADGITAEVLVVGSFDELALRADEAAGRIVVLNAPFTVYGETVQYRVRGAIEAARYGAVAALVRSVTPYSLQTPHTGGMRYEDDVERIPAAAITIEDAELLQRLQDRGERPVVTLRMGARLLPDALSRNVIAEVVGREQPEEVVVLGGHIDSWDVGQGAHDDAAGVMVTYEALRLLHRLGLQPRRTVRFIAWTNEENGLRGAFAYRDSLTDQELARHVLGLESDSGVFEPVSIGITASDEAFAMLKRIEPLILPVLGQSEHRETGITRGGGGADLIPLMRDGVPGAGFYTDDWRYFWYHHTEADTVDKVDPHHMARAVAAIATFIYVVAEMPERLPR
jgi:carboxypeptidase Q